MYFFLSFSHFRGESRIHIIKISALPYRLRVNLTEFIHKNRFKTFSRVLSTFAYANSKNLINPVIDIKSTVINNLLIPSL